MVLSGTAVTVVLETTALSNRLPVEFAATVLLAEKTVAVLVLFEKIRIPVVELPLGKLTVELLVVWLVTTVEFSTVAVLLRYVTAVG